MKRFYHLKHIFLSCLILPFAVKAEVKPHGLISDHMVLQQGVAVPIWGSAKEGEKVTVKFAGQTATTTAVAGRWLVRLSPLKANATPQTLTIIGENSVTINDVLVGEVWLCGGQSNMELFLNLTEDYAKHVAGANDPLLRLVTIPRGGKGPTILGAPMTWSQLLKIPWSGKAEPQQDVDASWVACDNSSIPNFSAVAYFFGRDLRKARGVPVGLINSSLGGTGAALWTSRNALESEPSLRHIVDNQTKAKAAGKRPRQQSAAPEDPGASCGPTSLYNSMIAPLQPFAIAGVIWYQGEADRAGAEQYKKLFPTLIKSWRDGWQMPEMPFLFVQLAPFDRMPPEIREAQLLTWQKVPHTAMVVITDHGSRSIHPPQKEPVGVRLALAARAIAYGEKIEYSGPVIDSLKVDGGKAILTFTHIGGGLVAKNGELKGFTVSGDGPPTPGGSGAASRNFVPATAKIVDATVVVSTPEVAQPKEIRFGWANVPEGNLFNEEGLPATPFRIQAK